LRAPARTRHWKQKGADQSAGFGCLTHRQGAITLFRANAFAQRAHTDGPWRGSGGNSTTSSNRDGLCFFFIVITEWAGPQSLE